MPYIEEAEIKGRAEGKTEGIKKEKLEIAKKMIHQKMDKQVIFSLTGLSESEIQRLEDQ